MACAVVYRESFSAHEEPSADRFEAEKICIIARQKVGQIILRDPWHLVGERRGVRTIVSANIKENALTAAAPTISCPPDLKKLWDSFPQRGRVVVDVRCTATGKEMILPVRCKHCTKARCVCIGYALCDVFKMPRMLLFSPERVGDEAIARFGRQMDEPRPCPLCRTEIRFGDLRVDTFVARMLCRTRRGMMNADAGLAAAPPSSFLRMDAMGFVRNWSSKNDRASSGSEGVRVLLDVENGAWENIGTVPMIFDFGFSELVKDVLSACLEAD